MRTWQPSCELTDVGIGNFLDFLVSETRSSNVRSSPSQPHIVDQNTETQGGPRSYVSFCLEKSFLA